MENIMMPFYEQYFSMLKMLHEKKKIVIGTLGPDSTSSVQAAKYFVENMQKFNNSICYELELFDTFDNLFEIINKDQVDFALVPSAYERITDFFWDIKLNNCFNFIFSTPEYGIVCKKDYCIDLKNGIKLATCSPVENIINELSEGKLKGNKVTKIITPSTTTALLKVINGEADLAVTNETSFEKYKDKGIKFIYQKYSAKIVWSLFNMKSGSRKMNGGIYS